MKIAENELNLELQQKINQLDSAKGTESNTYVSYENGKFISKSFSDLSMSEMYDMDEINEMRKHLYHSDDNYISSYDTELTEKNANGFASSSLLNTISGSFQFKTKENILKFKVYDTFLLAMDKSGVMYKINKSDVSVQSTLDALKIIKTNFVYKKFSVYDITDIEWFNTGVLISTENNGIFYLNFSAKDYSVLVQELNVEHIKLLSDKKTLLIAKNTTSNNIVLYDLLENKKIGIYNQLSKYNQMTSDIDSEQNSIYVLGKSFSVSPVDNLVHCWKMDSEEIEFNNIDREIAKNPVGNYLYKYIRHDDTSIYVLGVKDKKIFIWKYLKDELNEQPLEYIFSLQDTDYSSIKDFQIIGGKFFIVVNTQLLVLNENMELIENYLLGGTVKFSSVLITKTGMYATDGHECYLYVIPAKNYQKYTNITFNNTPSVNNIDVLIKMPTACKVIFLNSETNQQFPVAFHMVINNSLHVIKLSNIDYKKILIRIETGEQDKISGIVIHKNRIFYK